MDLATIKDKLKKQRYKGRDDYVKDIELIVSNALKYNNPGDLVHHDALTFRDVFQKSEQLAKIALSSDLMQFNRSEQAGPSWRAKSLALCVARPTLGDPAQRRPLRAFA